MLESRKSKKYKGIKKSVVKKSISHEDYKKCLFSGKKQLRKMNVIRSRKHEIFTEEINKISLSPNDDKRCILKDGIHTLALGHYEIGKEEDIKIEKYILDLEIPEEMPNVPCLSPIRCTPSLAPPSPQESSTSVEDLLDFLEKETKRAKKNLYINKIFKIKTKKSSRRNRRYM